MSVKALRSIRALAVRDLRLSLTSRVPFLFDVLGTLGALALYFYVGRFVHPNFNAGGLGFFAFATAGVATLRLQASLIKTVAALEREQASGTLELVLISPLSGLTVVVGSCLYELGRGLAFGFGAVLASRFLFGAGLTLGPRAWAGLACGFLGAVLFFLVIGVLSAAVVVAIKQGAAFIGFVTLALPVLSGAFFPPSVLPAPVSDVADALPLTMATSLLRDATVSATFAPLDALLMFGVLSVCVPLAGIVFALSLSHSTRRGTLAHQ